MANQDTRITTQSASAAERQPGAPRRPWSAPVLEALPPLTELTLQSFISGSGSISNGSASTVF